ncbi:HlyD family efflux transporter periplasmic adaptor subunit [Peptoniphilus mikwangii]|uniref:HlyD family efflux transporter periplasmic adaptor subunit n=1 Tax=Peptoniphilus mikwangii TaxID=1354300 RepID=UPI0003FD4273|nr:HlyD family efflux transporter periplasmic adaptor subunit [Peptoniphilus mikwangii]
MTRILGFFKRRKKPVIVAGIFLLLIIGFFSFRNKGGNYQPILKNETTELKKKEFVSAVNESGKVLSEDSAQIYAEKSLPVKEINIEVGMQVKKGDVIARLDDTTIKQQIAIKSAMIGATNKSTSLQVKNAQDKLDEALKNKSDGTNGSVVSANNAVTAAYDAWITAEKTYNNYKKSLEEGYNEQLVANKSTMDSLQNGANSAGLNYAQSNDRLNKEIQSLNESGRLAYMKSVELGNLKARDSENDRRIAELQRKQETLKAQSTAPQIDPVLSARLTQANSDMVNLKNRLEFEKLRVPKDENEINILQLSVENQQKLIDSIQAEIKNSMIDNSSLIKELENVTNQISELNTISKDLKAKIVELESDIKKYQAEVETGRKTIDEKKKDFEQQRLALENANKNISSNVEQKNLSDKSRQDMLKSYRKNADDLKHAYENAIKNVKVAEVAQDNEINALKNNLKTAGANGDTTVNSIELKNLYQDLERTVIKAPMDGTITEKNLIQGQVPTDYVAKIETIDRTIVESQIKEFDLNRVKVGMNVEITSDAFGKDKIFKGKVESINPTPSKKRDQSQNSNEVVYTTKISFDDTSVTDLKPGMSIRVKYVMEKKQNVFVVPSDAIYEKNKKSFILAVDGDSGVFKIREIEVTVSSGNDFESVIESKELNEKMRVINSPDNYSAGVDVNVVDMQTGV